MRLKGTREICIIDSLGNDEDYLNAGRFYYFHIFILSYMYIYIFKSMTDSVLLNRVDHCSCTSTISIFIFVVIIVVLVLVFVALLIWGGWMVQRKGCGFESRFL